MMFNLVKIVTDETEVALGQILKTVDPGLELEKDGRVIQVPFQDLESYELDAEDPEEATVMYVMYKGEEYELELPEKGTEGWDDLLGVIYPE